MRNERLKEVMTARGMTAWMLADAAGVDPKTVERWVSTNRVPYLRAAVRASEALGEDAAYLWPTLHQGRSMRSLSPEIVLVYEQRSQIAPADWQKFFQAASRHVDILVYAAVFLHEQVLGFNDMLAGKAKEGCRIRIALGDAHSPNVKSRGDEERFGHGIETRCELALMHYRPLMGKKNIEVRLHGTTLYNSIYRADDDMLVNAHIFGVNAFSAPVWHLKAGTGTMVKSYQESFETVWDQARPVKR